MEKKEKEIKLKTTRKKVKAIGTQKGYLTNEITGELHATEFEVVEIEDRDFDFTKVWLSHIIDCLGLLGGAKIKVAMYLIKKRDMENNIIMSMRDISKECKVSLRIVHETIKILREANFLIKLAASAYKVNPDIIFKGSFKQRMNVLIKYKKAEIKENKEKASLLA